MQLELPNPADSLPPVPVERLLAQAAAAAQAQRRGDAQAILQQAIAENPTSSAAWLACAAMATDPVERLTFLDRAIALEPGNARTRALAAKSKLQVIAHYGELGLAAARSGDLTAARQCFGEVIRLDPSHEQAWLRLASLAETPEEQIALLKQTLRLNPSNERTRASLLEAEQQLAKLYLRQAGSDLQQGRHDVARATLRRALQLDARCEDAWSLLALTSPDPDERRACAGRLRALRQAPPPEPMIVLDPVEVAEPVPSDDEASGGGQAPEASSPAPSAADAAECPASADPEVLEPPVEPLPVMAAPEPGAPGDADAIPDAIPSDGAPGVSADPAPASALAADDGVSFALDAPSDPVPPAAEPAAPAVEPAPPAPRYWACPLCETTRELSEPVCTSCGGVTTLDDISTLLKPRRVHQARLDAAVARLEPRAAEGNADDALAFGLALLNVRRYSDGLAQYERAVTLRAEDEGLRAMVSAIVARLRPTRTAEAAPRATVLVVDDSPTIRRVVASKLEKLRCRVLLAEDGAQAITQLRATVPDLILLDITMPNVDGYQVCKIVKGQPETRHVPVVFISGKDGFFDKARGRMAGSDAYVTKPFGPDALSRVLATFVPE